MDMKRKFEQRQASLTALITGFLVLGAGMARAENHRVSFSDDATTTLIFCAIILAGGRIVAAFIQRRKK